MKDIPKSTMATGGNQKAFLLVALLSYITLPSHVTIAHISCSSGPIAFPSVGGVDRCSEGVEYLGKDPFGKMKALPSHVNSANISCSSGPIAFPSVGSVGCCREGVNHLGKDPFSEMKALPPNVTIANISCSSGPNAGRAAGRVSG